MKATITMEFESSEELLEWAARLAPTSNGHVRTAGPLEDLVRAEQVAAEVPDERPWKPVPELLETGDPEPEEITKICRKCSKEFTTTSKVRVACDECFFEADALRPPPIVGRGRRPAAPGAVVLEGVNHGTNHAYKKGCRCEPCRAAHSDDMRAYAARRKAKEAAASA